MENSQLIPVCLQLILWRQELTAYIVELFVETLLFGAFTVTYTIGTWSLLMTPASRRRSTKDCVLLGASTATFGLALWVRSLYVCNVGKT